MKKHVVLLSFQKNIDVSAAVTELCNRYDDSTVLFSITDNSLFTSSVLNVLQKTKSKVKLFILEGIKLEHTLELESALVCLDPLKEMFKEIEVDDVLGIAWDNSFDAHAALASVEDFGLEIWDIADELSEISVDFALDGDEKEALLQKVLEKGEELAEAITEYVTMDVLNVLTETIMTRMQEEEETKDINPFKDGE